MHRIMKQNLYFRNSEELKKKVCELIDKCVDLTVTGDCITIEKGNNVKITCKVENGIKTKEIYIDAFFMQDIVAKIYSTIDIENLMGEPCRIIKIEILE